MKYGSFEVRAGDRVTIRRPDGRIAAGNVNPLLIFPTHCVLNLGNNGTIADASNIVGVRRARAKPDLSE